VLHAVGAQQADLPRVHARTALESLTASESGGGFATCARAARGEASNATSASAIPGRQRAA
jgi:hypothetical protein